MIVLMVIYNTRWCAVSFVNNLKIWSRPISESFGYMVSDKQRDLYSQKFGISAYRWINTVIRIFNCYDYITSKEFLLQLVTDDEPLCLYINTLLIEHHYYFPTVNVYAMLHQCTSIMSTMITCAIVASIPILLFFTADIIITAKCHCHFQSRCCRCYCSEYFLIDQLIDTLKREFPLRISSMQYCLNLR